MKVFILLVATLTFISCLSAAAVDTSASDKVQSEYDTFVKDTVAAKITESQTAIRAKVTEKVSTYSASLESARGKFVDGLKTQGDPTKAVVARFDKDLKAATADVNKEFSEATLKNEIDVQLNNVQAQILSVSKAQVAAIKAAVKRTPASSKCWVAYKAGLEDKFKIFSTDFQSKSQEPFTNFDAAVDAQTKVVEDTVAKYEAEAKTQCEGKDAKCYNDYFNKNYNNIKNPIAKSLTAVSTAKDTAVKEITKQSAVTKAQAEKEIKILNIDANTCIKNEDTIAAAEKEKYKLNPTTTVKP